MDQYREFCRLRDYRKPGVEVCQYTEAEAFALATNKHEEQSVSEFSLNFNNSTIAKICTHPLSQITTTENH